MEDNIENLLQCLRDHGVSFDRKDIETAFKEDGCKQWMHKYLHPDTLLTKEEEALYAVLQKSGEADVLSTSQDLSLVAALTEADIQRAIDELKRSTAAIEKQCETLRLQKNALNTLVKNNSRVGEARAQADAQQLRKWEMETGQVNNAIEKLSQDLVYQISDIDQQGQNSESSVRQTAGEILKSDDKLLLSLQKLAGGLDPGIEKEDDDVKRLRELCARLIKSTVDGVRTKLDRIYLQSLKASADANDIQDADEQEIQDLQEELESLYSEILPVAQMSAEQQFLEPSTRRIADREGQEQQRSVKAVEYIYSCLDSIATRLETFLVCAEELQCHRMAMKCAIDIANKELESSNKVDAPNTPSTIANTRKARVSSTSVAPLQKRDNRRRSSVNGEEQVDPELAILQSLGVAIPEDVSPDESLERILRDRLGKLENHTTSLQSSTEASIASQLRNANVSLRLLYDSLLDESVYHEVQFLDPDVKTSLVMFEKEVEDIQKTLEGIDLQQLQAKNVHRDELVERWSR